MTWYQTIALGCLGGAIPDILRVISLRYESVPKYLYQWFFWISLILLIALGGVVSYWLDPTRAIDALAIGYSAPGILSKLLGSERARDEFVLPTVPPTVAGSPMYVPNPLAPLQKWWAR